MKVWSGSSVSNGMMALLVVVLAGMWSAGVQAQATEVAPANAAPVQTVDLQDAYRKEVAFLSAQKRELGAQLETLQRQSAQQREHLSAEVSALQLKVLAATNQAEALSSQLTVADVATASNQESSQLLQATLSQAQTTLESHGLLPASDPAYADGDDAYRLEILLRAGELRLQQGSQVRVEAGRFHLRDGSEVQGQVVKVGNIASYGVSEQGSGALVPAGGGSFKLWRDAAEQSARALVAGQAPQPLRIFLYENVQSAINEPEGKTVIGEIQKGGLVGYAIVALGGVALLLIVARAFFLSGAGSSVHRISQTVEPLLREQRVDDAIVAAKRFKGSAARVVTATLRNLDRDREHLEDIVSESMLHENTRLNRFGSAILMIAGVAPLLGLLGTVTGMIQTFDVIADFGTSDPKLLSGGIATALVTTELGLIVAIPCLVVGNLMGGWAERIKDDMEKVALSVINLFKYPAARAAGTV